MAKSITIVFPFRLLASDPSYDPTKDILIGLVIAVQWNVIAHAESTDCTTPVIIITDGRITHSTFPQATTYWYGIYAQAGHSYAVEFEPPADNYPNAARVQFTALSVFGPNDSLQACRGTSTVAVTQNSGYAPVILKNGNGAGRRISFTARSAGLHLIAASNVASTGSYSFRALDTTMFNLRWSTWNGYDDQWGFLNISDMPITGTLTIYDSIVMRSPPCSSLFRQEGKWFVSPKLRTLTCLATRLAVPRLVITALPTQSSPMHT